MKMVKMTIPNAKPVKTKPFILNLNDFKTKPVKTKPFILNLNDGKTKEVV